MSVLRRPEVIVLLALVMAGLGWVAWSRRPQPAATPATVSELTIVRAVATRDGAHQRLRVEFSVRHSLPQAVEVRAPTVRLLDRAEATVPEFFRPGEFPPALPPGPPAASWVEFWLSEGQAAGPLTLEVAGARVEVRPVF